jgi:hypothetical protein
LGANTGFNEGIQIYKYFKELLIIKIFGISFLKKIQRDAQIGRKGGFMVSHIDPDAPFRENKQLHPLDSVCQKIYNLPTNQADIICLILFYIILG